MINKHTFSTTKTARYYTLGRLNDFTESIWFVFHGYGQLASEFLHEFLTSLNDSMFIVALEALNRFYIRGFNGKVGASWMTNEAREDEINDYTNFINTVYSKLIKTSPILDISFNVLAFSQGTHSAVRWMNRYNPKVNNLILWSGTFPHDINHLDNMNYWSTIKKKMVFGEKDRLIGKEKVYDELKYLNDQNMEIEILSFNGGHEIDQKLLCELLQNK